MDLHHITFEALENLGGIRSFRFADPALVATLGHPDSSNTVQDATTFTGAGQWWDGYLTEGSLEEPAGQAAGGVLVPHTFTGFIPDPTQALRPLLEEMQHRRVLFDVQDGNMQWRRLGSLRNLPRMEYRHTSGTAPTDRPGWRITVKWAAMRPAPVVLEHTEESGSGSGA